MGGKEIGSSLEEKLTHMLKASLCREHSDGCIVGIASLSPQGGAGQLQMAAGGAYVSFVRPYGSELQEHNS